MKPEGYEYQSEFARRYFRDRERARAEGREEGRQEGREEGREEGRVVEARAALRRVLDKRGFRLTGELQRRIADERDPERLARWHDRAISAASAEDVFVD